MLDYGLSQQQLAVICALSSGATLTDAAQQAGVHRNTINNWRRNLLPFQQALSDAQYDRALYFREKMENLADQAVETIRDILDNPEAPASVRLRAALAVMQTATAPPPPKKQVQLDIEKIVVQPDPTPVTDPAPESLHKNAQPQVAKVGRNETCPSTTGFSLSCVQAVQQAEQAAHDHFPPLIQPEAARTPTIPTAG